MPIRLLTVLFLGLLSLLPVGCAQQHRDAHPARWPTAATAEPHGPPAGSTQRHCAAGEAGEAVAPTARSVRPSAAPAPSSSVTREAGASAPGGRTASAARTARAPGPRGPLLATGRWRI
ncbi:hypothetical protein ACFQ6N_39805 [Kitasatospora sp. NPDC056446]|uniref:hypothetical protein n=1 Tax=Kitasatospora sp. NPDC056446 TaxID=3345819 RepID=UPI0036C1640E